MKYFDFQLLLRFILRNLKNYKTQNYKLASFYNPLLHHEIRKINGEIPWYSKTVFMVDGASIMFEICFRGQWSFHHVRNLLLWSIELLACSKFTLVVNRTSIVSVALHSKLMVD